MIRTTRLGDRVNGFEMSIAKERRLKVQTRARPFGVAVTAGAGQTGTGGIKRKSDG